MLDSATVSGVIDIIEHSLTGAIAVVMLVYTNRTLSDLKDAVLGLKEEVHLMKEIKKGVG